MLLALVGCETPAAPDAVPARWVYAPAPPAWPLAPATGTSGRSQPPQLVTQLGIAGPDLEPLRLPTPWAVPGDGPAHAIIYGTAGDASAVELLDIDAGQILWRDTTACGGPVVGVTEQVVVCAGAKGTRGLGLDGKPRWHAEADLVAMTGERVVTAGGGEAVILDANLGDELARVKLPGATRDHDAIEIDSILASCGDAGRELFAYGRTGELMRVAERAGGPTVTWATALPRVAAIDACEGTTVLVTTSSAAGTSLVALDRNSGKPTGTIDGVLGFWPARDGSHRLEISTSTGVALYPRDLTGTGEPLELPPLEELLAQRGELRLVRATTHTAALLDRRGVRAYLPLAQLGAVLGNTAIVAASWVGSPGETVHRYALPGRYRRALRVPANHDPLAVPAELRDLPATDELPVTTAIAKSGAAAHGIASIALAPAEPALYATTLERAPADDASVGLARLDLAARTWSWHRADACGTGTPVALAVSRELVVCASRTDDTATVYALGRDGGPRWQWRGGNVDAIDAAGEVVLVHDADRLHVLDATSGASLVSYASDDGGSIRATALDIEGMTLAVVYQRGRVIARLPRVDMVPAWTLEVLGVVRALSPAGDGVLVELEDGDAYRVDARTGAAAAVPGIGLTWGVAGDVITGQGPGGPVPPAHTPAPPASPPTPAKKRARRRGPPPPPRDPAEDPPVLPTPVAPPTDMPASWQLTLYELTGGLRVRNDYALDAPVTPGPRTGGDSPIAIQSGPGARELLVLDPRRGDPLRRVHLPDDAAPGTAFATIIDGKPVVGTLLVNPLRAVLF